MDNILNVLAINFVLDNNIILVLILLGFVFPPFSFLFRRKKERIVFYKSLLEKVYDYFNIFFHRFILFRIDPRINL